MTQDEDSATSLDAIERSKLRAALETGDADTLAKIIENDSSHRSICTPFEDGQLPLFIALEVLNASGGSSPRKVVEMIALLLEKKADVNIEMPPLKESPLQIAIRDYADAGDTETTPVLRHWACMRTIVMLLESNADPNHTDVIGEGPLAEAVVSNNPEICALLLAYGASSETTNSNGQRLADLDISAACRALLEGEEHEAPDEGDAFGIEKDHPLSVGEFAGTKKRASTLFERDESSSTFVHRSMDLNIDAMPSEVEKLHDEGKQHFLAKRYQEARHCYAQALEIAPDCAGLWAIKADSNLLLGEFCEALSDATEGVKKDMDHAKVHECCATCMLLVGNLEQAVSFCQLRVSFMPVEEFQQPSPEWKAFLDVANLISHHADVIEQIDEILDDPRKNDDISDAKRCETVLSEMIGQLSRIELKSPWGERLRRTRVKTLSFLRAGRSGQNIEERKLWSQQAVEEVEKLIEESPGDPSLQYLKGRCILRLAYWREARESFRKATLIDGHSHAASREALELLDTLETEKQNGDKAFFQRDYLAAKHHYDIAVRADSQRLDAEFSAMLLCNRAAASHKLGGKSILHAALEDLTQALILKLVYPKALIRRGLIFMDLERYHNAVASFDEAAKLEPGYVGLADWRARAKRWARKPPNRNYYAVLAVSFDATTVAIKKAYKVAALKWHPDKNPEDVVKAADVFKDIQEAFQVLCDPKQRREYDGLDDHAFDQDQRTQVPQPTYKPFFGANFGVGANFTNMHNIGPGAPGPLGQLRGASFGEGLGKGGHSGAMSFKLQGSAQRFAGWSYDGGGNSDWGSSNTPGPFGTIGHTRFQGKANR